jgi:hypothetical protein
MFSKGRAAPTATSADRCTGPSTRDQELAVLRGALRPAPGAIGVTSPRKKRGPAQKRR